MDLDINPNMVDPRWDGFDDFGVNNLRNVAVSVTTDEREYK